MQRLQTPEQAAQWLRERVSGCLRTDSKKIKPQDGFIAWPGATYDARNFVPIALEKGAGACLVEETGSAVFDWDKSNVPPDQVASYSGLPSASGSIAASFYQHPSKEMDVIAITGTNGKTTCAWWLAHALEQRKIPSSIVGTLGMGRPEQLTYSGMTTPDPVLLQSHLREMVDEGVVCCVMEASSIGIAEHRLDGTQVKLAMFTNFSQDHLDYHKDMERYWQAKETLFDWPGIEVVVINIDDPKGRWLVKKLEKNQTLQIWTFSALVQSAFEGLQHIQASEIQYSERGVQFALKQGESSYDLETTMVGDYNVSNLTGVITCLCALGHCLEDAVQACKHLPAVPGRMELLGAVGEPLVVVDFAHTPDAIEKVLHALKPLASLRGGELICIFGCGGERDKSKRPLMAAAAETLAQHIVLTSDNPRNEDPEAILRDMQKGLQTPQSARIVCDRAQAIAITIEQASKSDVVLIAGKGHEFHQEIKGVKLPFRDQWHAQQALQKRSLHV